MKEKKYTSDYINMDIYDDIDNNYNEENALHSILNDDGDSLSNENKKITGTNRKRKITSYIINILFLAISLFVAFFIGFILFHYNEYNLLFNIEKPQGYIISYYGDHSEELTKQDVFLQLKQKKSEIEKIEESLKSIDHEKELFIKGMDEKSKLFDSHISITDLKGNEERLKSIINLNMNKVKFKRELIRRINLFNKNYENQKGLLLNRREKLKNEMNELGQFMKNLEVGDQYASIIYAKTDIFIDEEKIKYLKRYQFFIDNQEYEKAIVVLRKLNSLEFDESNMIYKDILVDLLNSVAEYKERLNLLKEKSPFNEISMAYLSENYQKTLGMLDKAEKNGIIKPILSNLKEAVYQNLNSVIGIEEDINVLKNIKSLIKKAEILKEEGKYENAFNLYNSLLVLDIPGYDREYILQKIRKIVENDIRNRMRRDENTKASKYLGYAKEFYKNGDFKKSLNYYKLIITECSNSDYVNAAISSLEDLLTKNKQLDSI